MSEPEVLVHRSPDDLAQAVSARLITALVDAQSAGRVPHWVLTGGGIADRIHRAVAESPSRGAVDWSRVEIWWGDERFLPKGDPERNETQARAALLDQVAVDPSRVHAIPASDEVDDDPDRAADEYAAQLRAAATPEDHGPAPTFDVLMLGVGPDGHVASLFPEKPALYEEERTVVAVRGSPKPPPVRITLTMPVLNRSRDLWFVVAGDDKASAVRLALSGAGVVQVPAAGPRGIQRTIWFLDRAAASQLPAGLARIASP
jgi:6-phosphogluconolactonase